MNNVRRKKKKNKKKNNIINYRKRPSGIIFIIAVLFVYVCLFAILSFNTKTVQTYEVDTGSISSNVIYTAIALREEKLINSQYSGNINYYQKESGRVKVGDTVYTVDETGRVAEILANYSGMTENSLSKEDLLDIRQMLNQYRTSYDGNNFSLIYDLKTELNASILQALNESIIENLDDIVAGTGSENLFQTISATETGTVVYSYDGFEAITPETINMQCFDKSVYNKTNLKTENLIVKDNPAYKLITNEKWDMVIPLDKEDIDKQGLMDKKTINVRILKDNIRTNCGFNVYNIDGQYYGRISLNKYMVRYATERFINIEINASSVEGLKIPASAIVEQLFYVIPKRYVEYINKNADPTIIVESYINGEIVSDTVKLNVFRATEDNVYIRMSDIAAGTSVVARDSMERYVIGPTEKIKGVYCVNTGYTEFRMVDIIDQNNEYVISRRGIGNGVSLYSRIILDGTNYSENQLVY